MDIELEGGRARLTDNDEIEARIADLRVANQSNKEL